MTKLKLEDAVYLCGFRAPVSQSAVQNAFSIL